MARSMRVSLPRKSVRLFTNDAAQSTPRRLFAHASNLADKCGTERAERRRRHQIIGFIDLHPVIRPGSAMMDSRGRRGGIRFR
ncbi:hypothetical protein [Mesorhizobium sp. AA22]|uniref:hypothetical protein n=1 Tax=Mesorhizobium sp. AA22 TaxID=1854057 RepID=UPI00193EFBC3|nr:hypothetical protein [Mesorhizobium sp. AA22]